MTEQDNAKILSVASLFKGDERVIMTPEERRNQARHIAVLLTHDDINPFGMMKTMFCKGMIVFDKTGIVFDICRNTTRANMCKITYDSGSDLFDMEFIYRYKKKNSLFYDYTTVSLFNGLYGDCLRSTFEETTGLYTNFKG